VRRAKWLSPEEADADAQGGAADGMVEGEGEQSSTEHGPLSAADIAKVMPHLQALPEGASAKEAAMLLVKLGHQLGLRLPAEALAANQRAGTVLMGCRDEDGRWDLIKAVQELAKVCGTEQAAQKKEAAEQAQRPQARVPANDAIANCLDELGTLEGEAKEGANFAFKVKALKMAASAVRSCEFKIESGKQVSSGKLKLDGVGKSTGVMVDEIIATGTTPRLVFLRQAKAAKGT
jgi:hypothetical protein